MGLPRLRSARDFFFLTLISARHFVNFGAAGSFCPDGGKAAHLRSVRFPLDWRACEFFELIGSLFVFLSLIIIHHPLHAYC